MPGEERLPPQKIGRGAMAGMTKQTGPESYPLPKLEPKGRTKAPPLFIKVDRYQDITGIIDRLKLQATHLRDAIDAMQELQRELNTGLELAAQALDRFAETVTAMDNKLVRFSTTTDGVPDHADLPDDPG